jgi:hypothetical protein
MTDVVESEKMAAENVKELEPRIQVIHFAVELPPSALQGMDEPAPQMPTPADNVGVVGTITLLNKSAMVWFGWGRLLPSAGGDSSITARGVPTMGQVAVGMPRTQYSGAFSDSHESSCSQLIGGNDDDCLQGTAMAARLSQKIGYPIIVSGGLSSQTEMMASLLSGVDPATAAQRAAALTEKEVARILQEQKTSQSESQSE